MTLRANVAQAQYSLSWQLPFDGKEIVFRIRIGVTRDGGGHAGLRVVNAVEDDAGIRVTRSCVQRRER